MNEMCAAVGGASVQGGVALMVVWLLCRFLPRLPAGLRCWLWRLAFLKCLVGLIPVLGIAVPLLPATLPAASPVAALRPTANVPTSRARVEVSGDAPTMTERPVALTPDVTVSDSATDAVNPASERRMSPSWSFWLAILYAVGVATGGIRLLWAGLRMTGLIRRAATVERSALPELAALFGLRNIPRLALSSEIVSPMLTFGTILLPNVSDTATDETVTEERLILAHELAHWKRRDLAWEWLGAMTNLIFWFHPLVWWARREEKLLREQAADALVIAVTAAAPADYARTLLSASLRRNRRVPMLTVGAVGAVEGGSRLGRRLEALGRPGLSRRRVLMLGAFACALVALTYLPWRAVARQPVAPQSVASPVLNAKIEPTVPPDLRGNMTGIVTDGDGRAVGNAKVSWVVPAAPKSRIIAETTTNAKGEFAFANIVNGELELGTSAKEYWRLRLDGWVMVKANGYGLGALRVRYEKRNVAVRLTPPQTYTAVFHDTNGAPIVGLPVYVDSLNNAHTFFPLRWLGYAGTTDNRGEFKAQNLPQNDAVWFRFDPNRWSVANQEETENKTRTVYTLDRARILEGIVRFPDGRPAPNVNLQLDSRGEASRWSNASAETNAEGRYRLVGLTPGRYLFRVWTRGLPNFVGPNPTNIEIPKTPTVSQRNFTLTPAAIIAGQVTDTSGRPLPDLNVSSGNNYETTDRDGHYTILVPTGEATVTVENTPKTIRARLGTPVTLDFVLSPQNIVRLRGQVLDSRGEPVPGISVSIQNNRTVSGATTDSEGKFNWRMRVESGKPLTVFAHKGEEGATGIIAAGEEQFLTLKMSEASVGHVTGQVTDANGKAIPNLTIDVSEALLTSADNSVPVDAQGRFHIPVRPDAPYGFRFRAPGYGTRSLPAIFDAESGMNENSQKDRISLKAGVSKDLGRIILTKGKDVATGRLLDVTGKPISRAEILLVTPDGDWAGSTDAEGRFSLAGVVQGQRATLFAFPHEGPRMLALQRGGLTIGAMGTLTLKPPVFAPKPKR